MFKIWIDYDLNTDLYPLLNNEAELIGPLVHPNPEDPLSEVEDADADLLREMVQTFTEALMGAEVDVVCGAPRRVITP